MPPTLRPTPETQPVISVKLAITNPTGNYLLLTRAETDKNRPGTADLPGGGVDPGESPQAACLREAYEELGIELRPTQLGLSRCLERMSSYGHLNQRHFWRVVLESSPDLTLNPAEHSAFHWLPREEVYGQLTHPPLREGFALAAGIIGLDQA